MQESHNKGPDSVQRTGQRADDNHSTFSNTNTIGYLVGPDWQMSDDDETTDTTGQDSPIPYRPSEVPVAPDALREGGVL